MLHHTAGQQRVQDRQGGCQLPVVPACEPTTLAQWAQTLAKLYYRGRPPSAFFDGTPQRCTHHHEPIALRVVRPSRCHLVVGLCMQCCCRCQYTLLVDVTPTCHGPCQYRVGRDTRSRSCASEWDPVTPQTPYKLNCIMEAPSLQWWDFTVDLSDTLQQTPDGFQCQCAALSQPRVLSQRRSLTPAKL